jgi:hypothetical protein
MLLILPSGASLVEEDGIPALVKDVVFTGGFFRTRLVFPNRQEFNFVLNQRLEKGQTAQIKLNEEKMVCLLEA